MNRIICFTFTSSNAPYEIIIADENNFVLAKRTILSNISSMCICTRSCRINIYAKYNDTAICNHYCLTRRRCQRINASFNFPIITTNIIQTFELLDATYNLPVANANLSFAER